MPRTMRVEYPGAIYHLMDRGDRREDIFINEVDRQDFLKTLAEACQKTGWQVHAYCLMRNHFHLVVETPEANRVAGMRWFLSAYTIRLNHRQKLFGHVFSGRYKALMVEASGNGYLKSACDYVHLNPARANLLGREDRLLGEHGIQQDSAAGRQEFERRMESRRFEQLDEAALKPFRRGWCLGSDQFKQRMLELMEGKLGENHSGQLHRQTAEQKANRIIAEELSRLGWNESDLARRLKNDATKLRIAARVRKETTLPIKWIAARLQMGTSKSVKSMLHGWMQALDNPANHSSLCQQPQLL